MKRLAKPLLLLALVLVPFVVLAQTAPATAVSSTAIATKIVGIALLVTTALQGIKRFVPQVNGKVAIALTVLGSIAAAYAVAPSGQVLSIDFLLTTVGAALSSNGIYHLVKVASGNTPAAP